MAVYMIRAGDEGPVKIGSARDPVHRMQTLQISHYLALKIVRVFEGGPKEEYALHKRFSHLMIRGEWFAFTSELMGDIGLPETTIEALQEAARCPYSEVPDGYNRTAFRFAVGHWKRSQGQPGAPATPFDVYDEMVRRGALNG